MQGGQRLLDKSWSRITGAAEMLSFIAQLLLCKSIAISIGCLLTIQFGTNGTLRDFVALFITVSLT